jgi:hypothetical protein
LMFLSRTEQRVCHTLTYLQLCQSQVFQISCMHALTPAKSTCADACVNPFQDERLHFKPLTSRACLKRVACSPGCLASAPVLCLLLLVLSFTTFCLELLCCLTRPRCTGGRVERGRRASAAALG